MSTNYVEQLPTPQEPDKHAAGAIMAPRHSPDSMVTSPEILSNRTRALAATLIKERFQKLPSALSADERDSKRAQLRGESVRQLFKIAGILPLHDDAAEQTFDRNYTVVEESVADIDKNHLVDLIDTYETHVAMGVFDTLAQTSSISKDDLVFMRRASLLLLEQYSPQQPE